MSELARWDCWGFDGEMEHVNKPVPMTATFLPNGKVLVTRGGSPTAELYTP